MKETRLINNLNRNFIFTFQVAIKAVDTKVPFRLLLNYSVFLCSTPSPEVWKDFYKPIQGGNVVNSGAAFVFLQVLVFAKYKPTIGKLAKTIRLPLWKNHLKLKRVFWFAFFKRSYTSFSFQVCFEEEVIIREFCMSLFYVCLSDVFCKELLINCWLIKIK